MDGDLEVPQQETKRTGRNDSDDKFTRNSFGLRRMASRQLWGITLLAAAIVIAALFYTLP